MKTAKQLLTGEMLYYSYKYGMRNAWTATSTSTSSSDKHYKIQATAFRHGQGKTRAARLATSIREAMQPNTFVCETTSYKVTRAPHTVAPKQLAADASLAVQVDHEFQKMESQVYKMVPPRKRQRAHSEPRGRHAAASRHLQRKTRRLGRLERD